MHATMKCCIIPRTSLLHHTLHHHYHCQPPRFLRHPQRSLSAHTRTPQVVLAAVSLVLAEVAQPKGDINVFLQTGGLMFSAYLLANFVVPSIVSKQMMSDESGEKESDSKPNQNIVNEQQPKKNRGFNSTKP